MKDTTFKIYIRVIKLIAKRENLSIEKATTIVDNNKAYFIDTVENSGEDTVTWLATNMFELFNRVIHYTRKPTEYEIKFGYGATHHLDVPNTMCRAKDGRIKKRWKNPVDGLIYTQNYTS